MNKMEKDSIEKMKKKRIDILPPAPPCKKKLSKWILTT